MAIGNEELVHEYFPKHSGMGTVRIEKFEETEEGKTRGVSMKRSNVGLKKISPNGLSIAPSPYPPGGNAPKYCG